MVVVLVRARTHRLTKAEFSGDAANGRCGIEEIEPETFGGESDFMDMTSLKFSYCSLRKIVKNTFGSCCTYNTPKYWASNVRHPATCAPRHALALPPNTAVHSMVANADAMPMCS